jgi:hypothetical protein
MSKYIVTLILASCGTLALLASLFNWNWFFNTRSVRSWASYVSRRTTRRIYGALGCLMLFMAVMTLLRG